jgi:hypothetical protein
MRDGAEVKRSLAVHFVVTDICSYVLTLAMAWFQKQNPELNYDSRFWHWRTCTKAEDRPLHLVSVGSFVAMMCAEHT